jgi:hypothetical protein
MFPVGTVGAALFLLRMLVVTNLVWEGTAHWTLVTSAWIAIAFVIPAICLAAGVLTPYFAIFGCVIQMIATYEVGGRHGLQLVLSILSSAVLAALGPGAYSIDSLLFGRKKINIPPRR